MEDLPNNNNSNQTMRKPFPFHCLDAVSLRRSLLLRGKKRSEQEGFLRTMTAETRHYCCCCCYCFSCRCKTEGLCILPERWSASRWGEICKERRGGEFILPRDNHTHCLTCRRTDTKIPILFMVENSCIFFNRSIAITH